MDFRLLSELYSFLYLKAYAQSVHNEVYISVSYRSYILSYEFFPDILRDLIYEFPSPIGVIFFLILYSKKLLFAIFYKAIIV